MTSTQQIHLPEVYSLPLRWLSMALATLAQDLEGTAGDIDRKRGISREAEFAIPALNSEHTERYRTITTTWSSIYAQYAVAQ